MATATEVLCVKLASVLCWKRKDPGPIPLCHKQGNTGRLSLTQKVSGRIRVGGHPGPDTGSVTHEKTVFVVHDVHDRA